MRSVWPRSVSGVGDRRRVPLRRRRKQSLHWAIHEWFNIPTDPPPLAPTIRESSYYGYSPPMDAEEHFHGFVQTLASLLHPGLAPFDLVVAPYNSGAVMVRLAEKVAAARGVSFWPTLLIPVYTPYRFLGDDGSGPQTMPYQNSALIPKIGKFLFKLPHPPRALLFIDDEIGNGRAFEECLSCITSATTDGARLPSSCVIVASENGSRSDYSFPGVSVRFISYARRPSPDASGIIFDLVSDSLMNSFRGVGSGLLDKKQVASILLGLPVKTLVDGVPRITQELNTEAEKAVPDLASLRADFEAYIDRLITMCASPDNSDPLTP